MAAVPFIPIAAQSERGQSTAPPRPDGPSLEFALSGDELAELAPWLPFTPPRHLPPYRFEGLLTHERNAWSIHDLSGAIGVSDISGDLIWNSAGEPPLLQANLYSNRMNLTQLLGEPEPRDTLISDQPVDLSFLRAIEALVLYRAAQIQTSEITFENVLAELSLRDGLAIIDPLRFGLVGGFIKGRLDVTEKAGELVVSLDINIRRVDLKKVLATLGVSPDGFGTIFGRIEISGHGRSLAGVLASADGNVSLAMEGGRVDALLLQTAEFDFGAALALNANKEKEEVAIRCLIADFKVRDGIMKTRRLLIDTPGTKIVGHGTIKLGADWFADLTLSARAKELALLSGDAPVHVRGAVTDLRLDVEWLRLIFSLLTPIELGKANDAKCQQLTEAVRQ
jgi:AsmA family protein